MLMGCYLRQGKVYVPVQAKTEAGYYLDIEPVAVAAVTDTRGLRDALLRTFARGNPVVPTPARASFPDPAVLKHAGVKTWGAFARGMRTWSVRETDGLFRILGKQKHPIDGWVDDPAQTVNFPAGTEIGVVIDRLIDILQQAAQEESQKPN